MNYSTSLKTQFQSQSAISRIIIFMLLLFSFVLTIGIDAWGGVIDFETTPCSGSAQPEGYAISNQYKTCEGVSFLMRKADGATFDPSIGVVGGSSYYGFQGPSSAYSACGIKIPTDKDMPSDASKAAVGCRFLTGGFSTGTDPDTLEITYDSTILPNVHQASGELIDIDGDEAWRVEAKDVGGNTLGQIDLSSTAGITGNCSAAVGTVTGDGISTKWCFDLPPSANPIKKITVSFTGSSQLHNVGFAFDNFNASATGDSTTLPADPCCPPWNTDMLEEMMVYQGTGGIGDDYTLKFQPTSAFNTALEAYVAYLHALNPAINTIHIHFNLHDAGAGSIPTGGPLMPPEHWEAWTSSTGPSPPPNFFSQPLHVNRWYRVHTGIYLNDNLTFFSDSCANNDIYVRIQVQGKHGGYTGVLQMRTKDGRVIEKKIAPGTTSKQPPTVNIEKTHSPGRFSTGSKGTFMIKVKNKGADMAAPVNNKQTISVHGLCINVIKHKRT